MKLHAMPKNSRSKGLTEFERLNIQRPPLRSSVKRQCDQTDLLYQLSRNQRKKHPIQSRCEGATYIRKLCYDIGKSRLALTCRTTENRAGPFVKPAGESYLMK